MRKLFCIFCLIIFFPVILNAQPQHFTFTSNTGDSYGIIIDNGTLDGNPLQNGDEIGVVTPAGLYVGAVVRTGTTPLGLSAWEDDPQTENTVDGYVKGEAMSFEIWVYGTDIKYNATASYTQGNGKFSAGVYARLSLSAISGTTESIAVVSPNGGEDWETGSMHEIQWSSSELNISGANVTIEYSNVGGATFTPVDGMTYARNTGSYSWTIPNTPSTNCLVRIFRYPDGTPADTSDGVFTISQSVGPAGRTFVVTNTSDSGFRLAAGGTGTGIAQFRL